jgi:hypothetical protein
VKISLSHYLDSVVFEHRYFFSERGARGAAAAKCIDDAV